MKKAYSIIAIVMAMVVLCPSTTWAKKGDWSESVKKQAKEKMIASAKKAKEKAIAKAQAALDRIKT